MKYSTALTFVLPSFVAAALETDQSALADVVSVGDRPYFLLDMMKPSILKDKLGETRTREFIFLDDLIFSK